MPLPTVRTFAVVVVSLLVPVLVAQDASALNSGPAAGIELPACTVYAPSGPFAGTEFDAAQRIGKGPGVLLFVNELTRNTAPIITGLDRLAVQLAWTGLETHTIRIAADRNEAEVAVRRTSDALQLHRPTLMSTEGGEGPGGYVLNRKAALTLVLAKDGKVVRSIAFTDTGRADLPKLRGLVEEVTGPIPTDPKALREAMEQRLTRDPERLRRMTIELALLVQSTERISDQRAQRNAHPEATADAVQPGDVVPQRPREGKPPEDEELHALLRRATQKAATTEELDAVFAAVTARVGDDAALQKQALDMWKLMLSLDYGNEDGKRRARAWVEKHGGK